MNTFPIPHNPKLSPAELQHQKLQTQTRKWVAQTFYGTILKQMHDSPFKDKLFSGGRGGDAFGSLMDQQMADKMSRSSGSKLVDSIVNKIEFAHGKRGVGKKLHNRQMHEQIAPTQLNVRA